MIVSVPITSIVLDRSLQCRVGVDNARVGEYAAAIQEGAVFPPLTVVEVEGVLYLVDGWHRLHAYEECARGEVEVVVTQGTRRDALLAAVSANAHHGLNRSTADKRRSVYTLLGDAEWCALSSRELGRLAGVSHTYVNQLRAAYGVAVGDVLTAERQAEVDGEPSPEWAPFYQNIRSWDRPMLDKIRTAPDVEALLETDGPEFRKACLLRWSQLAKRPWLWPDADETERINRANSLDTYAELVQALQSVDCPDPERLIPVARLAWRIENYPEQHYDLEKCAKLLEGRPELMAWVAARQAAAPPLRAWALADDIRDLPAPAQPSAIQAASKATLMELALRQLRGPALAALADALGADGQCADPECRGPVAVLGQRGSCCLKCSGGQERIVHEQYRALSTARTLIELGARTLDVGGVTINLEALGLLAALHGMVQDQRTYQLPKTAKDAFVSWAATLPPEAAK